MSTDRITDGKRIAQLLASELDGRADTGLGAVAVTDADRAAEPSDDGTFAYAVAIGGTRLAEVYLQPDRARIEFRTGVEAAIDAARDADLRVRPAATTPPRTLVFVESGAAVKRAADVVGRVAAAVGGTDRGEA